ncbi:hypothetical protein [Nocardioides aurantiacus]|uniref:hypothetical protein n=1 Tax=Nocardioides aurantiacus TaxID=86796 RepID=UPI00403F76A4
MIESPLDFAENNGVVRVRQIKVRNCRQLLVAVQAALGEVVGARDHPRMCGVPEEESLWMKTACWQSLIEHEELAVAVEDAPQVLQTFE